ncbi:MAG: tripartite tricarboxylate transporter substrate binding protein [Betaproteobacteria bacterium]|nr:tripartite tricarboxylate transporter substrate binding protein [Betaproteobacteria bacterium]
MKTHLNTLMLLAVALVLDLAPAAAQEKFPSRQITIIVGFAAGGGGDISARWIGDYAREKWKVPVIVENRPGAGATIAATLLAKATPDGYTVALATTSPYTIAPYFQPVSYDPSKDFTYLFQFLVSAQPLFVRSDSPHKSWQDFVAWARANPGTLNWSTAATNGGPHIATEAAFRHLGIRATYIPFKGGAEAITALLGGHIHALVAAEFPPYAAAGQVRLLAESGPDKIADYPAVPTYKELGMPLSVPIFYGIAAPAGVPAAAVAAWDELAREMVNTAGFKDLMSKLKSQPSYMGGREFTNSVVNVYRTMGKLAPELGLGKP